MLHLRGWMCVALLSLAVLAMAGAGAAILLDEDAKLGPAGVSRTDTFSFTVADTEQRVGWLATSSLEQGALRFSVVDAAGEALVEKSLDKGQRVSSRILPAATVSGTVKVEVVLEEAVGSYHVLAVMVPEPSAFYPMLATGPLMILVALYFALGWRRRTGTKYRWFWAGAGLWAFAVAIKFAWALLLNQWVIGALDKALPEPAYLLTGSLYVGLQSAITEIGFTLVFALLWRRMALEPNRAVAVGVGAGSFEALLLGVAGLTGILYSMSGMPGSDVALVSAAYLHSGTPLLWLCGPAERIIAILCHISSRTLVLYGVATRKWLPFCYAFLLFTALDGVAGWAHLGGIVGRYSMWWIELAILPAAIISVPAISWCIRHWPESADDALPNPGGDHGE